MRKVPKGLGAAVNQETRGAFEKRGANSYNAKDISNLHQ